MDYKKITHEQLFSGEVKYTLEDFERDFRKDAIKSWGKKKLDKKHKNGNTLYQGILFIVVFTSQKKSPKEINELLLGKSTKELEESLETIIDMYKKEIYILEGLQMNMFLENIKKYRASDSLNLMLLNTNFRKWFIRAMEDKRW